MTSFAKRLFWSSDQYGQKSDEHPQSLHTHRFKSDLIFSHKPALFPVNYTTIGPTRNLLSFPRASSIYFIAFTYKLSQIYPFSIHVATNHALTFSHQDFSNNLQIIVPPVGIPLVQSLQIKVILKKQKTKLIWSCYLFHPSMMKAHQWLLTSLRMKPMSLGWHTRPSHLTPSAVILWATGPLVLPIAVFPWFLNHAMPLERVHPLSWIALHPLFAWLMSTYPEACLVFLSLVIFPDPTSLSGESP